MKCLLLSDTLFCKLSDNSKNNVLSSDDPLERFRICEGVNYYELISNITLEWLYFQKYRYYTKHWSTLKYLNGTSINTIVHVSHKRLQIPDVTVL